MLFSLFFPKKPRKRKSALMQQKLSGRAGSKVTRKEFEEMKAFFYAEIRKKDEIIRELELKNKALLKSAIKQAERTHEWRAIAEKIRTNKKES